MEYHLIAFFGASPGAGKSTLSAFLSQQFRLHRLSHRWIYEEDPLPEFQPFFQALQERQPGTIAQFLRATAAFASTCATTHLTIIDSILPGYSFFFGTQPPATIADMSQHLHTILAPLRPVLVYGDADPMIALERAITQRGTRWFERMVERMNTWYLPLAPALFTDVVSVAAFEQESRQLAHELLAQWTGPKLLLDSTTASLPQLKAQVLASFGLDELEAPPILPNQDRRTYVGRYVTNDPANSAPPVVIDWADDQLVIDRYWPAGTRLLMEDQHRFRLENTNYWVHFNVEPDGRITGLTINLRGQLSVYRKEASHEG